MAKTPKVGDKVLFYGRDLVVTGIESTKNVAGEAVDLVHAALHEPAALDKMRNDARARIVALRAEQATAAPERHANIANEITALSAAASEANMRVSLRLNLLAWWPERSSWVSDGRILSDAQLDAYRARFGRKPRPEEQRAALITLGG